MCVSSFNFDVNSFNLFDFASSHKPAYIEIYFAEKQLNARWKEQEHIWTTTLFDFTSGSISTSTLLLFIASTSVSSPLSMVCPFIYNLPVIFPLTTANAQSLFCVEFSIPDKNRPHHPNEFDTAYKLRKTRPITTYTTP